MSFIWVIEKDLFSENEEKFIKCANIVFVKNDYLETLKPTNPKDEIPEKNNHKVIFYGSVDLGKKLHKLNYGWQILLDRSFDCNFWMSRFKNHFNAMSSDGKYNSSFVPFGCLEKHILNNFKDKVFIRPNSGNKLFTGHVIRFDDEFELKRELKFIQYTNVVFPEDLIFCSEAKEIDQEYRFVIAGSHKYDYQYPISWSMYKDKLQNKTSPNVPQRVKDWVINVLREDGFDFRPFPLWVMDVAVAGDNIFVLETNSFSFSGFYDCNIEKIVFNAQQTIKEDLEL